MNRYVLLVFLIFLGNLGYASNWLVEKWTRLAIHGDNTSLRELRLLGPKGLDALMKKYVSLHKGKLRPDVPQELEQQIRNAIDIVAGQKYASFSGLYWYKDLEVAKRMAKKENKPILSLRLLGNLDDEFC